MPMPKDQGSVWRSFPVRLHRLIGMWSPFFIFLAVRNQITFCFPLLLPSPPRDVLPNTRTPTPPMLPLRRIKNPSAHPLVSVFMEGAEERGSVSVFHCRRHRSSPSSSSSSLTFPRVVRPLQDPRQRTGRARPRIGATAQGWRTGRWRGLGEWRHVGGARAFFFNSHLAYKTRPPPSCLRTTGSRPATALGPLPRVQAAIALARRIVAAPWAAELSSAA